jgi:hypothetical protein
MSGYLASRITLDVGNGVAPEDSTIEYGPEELEFRERVEEQLADFRKKYPDAILDVKE